jgi:hypothetical protein
MLIHTHHATLLPFSDSAVSFLKVRMVTGNTRTPRGSLKPNVGRSPTYHLWTADVNSRHAMPMLCHGLEKLLSERHGRGMAWAWLGMCELALSSTVTAGC